MVRHDRIALRHRLVLLAVAAITAGLLVPAVRATAAPVCDGADKSDCGGRTFPEPEDSQTALSHDETVRGLASLEAEFPGLVDISVFGESFDGLELLAVELTDEASPTPLVEREVVVVSQSIHGNEPGGREGGVRWLEDVLRDPTHPTRDLLDEVRVVQLLPNPDGWRSGDPPFGTAWRRGNGNGGGVGDSGGVDLNRQLPWHGWIPSGRTPLSQPESRALVDEIDRRLDAGESLVASADVHGEVDETGAWIMLSSGEFDLAEMFTQVRHGEAVDAAVTSAIADHPLITDAGVEPAFVTASSEFGPPGVGGSGSGFLGDWLAQREGGGTASISTIELFDDGNGPGTSAATFDADLIQLYRVSVAAIMQALVEQAVVDTDASVVLDGAVGYVRDPATTTDPVIGGERTPMQFFDDLAPFLTEPLESIAPDEVSSSLGGLAALVVTSDLLHDDPAALDAIGDFVDGGGRLVLTDSGVRLLAGLSGDVDEADVTRHESNLAPVDLSADPSDPLLVGVRDNAFLLVEPATLGYRTTGSGDTPSWRVATSTLESAGGASVGTTAGATSIGRLPLGAGVVTTIGTLLPQPTAANRVEYGLNDHAVLDTGYRILVNALDADLVLGEDGGPGPGPTPTPTPTDDPTGSPSPDPDGEERTLDRIAGDTRIATAIEVSRATFRRAGAAVLARSDAFPDALTGTVLAAQVDGPVLLNPTDGLAPAVTDELARLGVDEVVLLGGPAALDEQVADDLRDRGIAVTRLGGDDRHATARRVAEELRRRGAELTSAVLARSDDFADALAASTLATATTSPIVLTPTDSLHPEAAALLDELVAANGTVTVAGGSLAVSDDVVAALRDRGFTTRRLAGADRYATGVRLVEAAVAETSRALDPLYLASGADFPDALSAGPAAAATGGVVLLVDPNDLRVSDATQLLLVEQRDAVRVAHVVGGSSAVAERVEGQVRRALDAQRR